MKGAYAACTALSHPVQPLLVPLRAHTCLCRHPESWVVLNPACSCSFGYHKMEIMQTYLASFVSCSFSIHLFMNTIRVYGIHYYIKKIPFLNHFCSSQLFFFFFYLRRSSVIQMEIFYLPQNCNINIFAGWNFCNLGCDWSYNWTTC